MIIHVKKDLNFNLNKDRVLKSKTIKNKFLKL